MMVINTKTLDEYIEVIEWAIDQGMSWFDKSKSIHEEYWGESHRSKTCIVIKNESSLTFCRRRYIIETYETNILDMVQFRKLARKYRINKFRNKFDLR